MICRGCHWQNQQLCIQTYTKNSQVGCFPSGWWYIASNPETHLTNWPVRCPAPGHGPDLFQNWPLNIGAERSYFWKMDCQLPKERENLEGWHSCERSFQELLKQKWSKMYISHGDFFNNIFQVPLWISDVKHSSPTQWSVQIVSKICTGMFSNWSGMHTASHSSNHCNTITGIYLWQTTCAKPNNKSHKFVKCQFCRTTISGFRHVRQNNCFFWDVETSNQLQVRSLVMANMFQLKKLKCKV